MYIKIIKFNHAQIFLTRLTRTFMGRQTRTASDLVVLTNEFFNRKFLIPQTNRVLNGQMYQYNGLWSVGKFFRSLSDSCQSQISITDAGNMRSGSPGFVYVWIFRSRIHRQQQGISIKYRLPLGNDMLLYKKRNQTCQSIFQNRF